MKKYIRIIVVFSLVSFYLAGVSHAQTSSKVRQIVGWVEYVTIFPQNLKIKTKLDIEIEYKFGTIIELPRAGLTADKIAEYADFISFGTNDLTQTTFGISRVNAFILHRRCFFDVIFSDFSRFPIDCAIQFPAIH